MDKTDMGAGKDGMDRNKSLIEVVASQYYERRVSELRAKYLRLSDLAKKENVDLDVVFSQKLSTDSSVADPRKIMHLAWRELDEDTKEFYREEATNFLYAIFDLGIVMMETSQIAPHRKERMH